MNIAGSYRDVLNTEDDGIDGDYELQWDSDFVILNIDFKGASVDLKNEEEMSVLKAIFQSLERVEKSGRVEERHDFPPFEVTTYLYDVIHDIRF